MGIRATNGQCGSHQAFHLDLVTGVYTDLHALLVGGAPGMSRAFDINDSGFVVGEGSLGGTNGPFLWHADEGFTLLPAVPGAMLMHTHFEAINNLAQAVGAAIVNDQEWHAISWDGLHGVRDLNDLVELPANFIVDRATKINDNGWIIGSGHYGSWSPPRAVVLIPISNSLPADLDDDGAVGVVDLLMLLGSWGPCDAPCPPSCAADLDGDCAVGVTDFLFLLGSWG